MKRVLSISLAILLGGGAYILGWTETFVVKEVKVVGVSRVPMAQVEEKLRELPGVVEVGTPLGRVDKGRITERLRQLPWIDRIKVNRDFVTGEVRIELTSRKPIARFETSARQRPELVTFLAADLAIFSVSANGSPGESPELVGIDWSKLPVISLGNTSQELRSEAAELLAKLDEAKVTVVKISASDGENLTSKISYRGHDLDISWGNVNDLPVKLKVLNRLLDLKQNKSASAIDLRNPETPTVR